MRYLSIIILLFGFQAHANWDVYFANEPNEDAKAIMVFCGEESRFANPAAKFWHCFVTEENYNHADMPANKIDPDDPQARALYEKPNPKGGDPIPVRVIGIGRTRSRNAGGNIHPLSAVAIKQKKVK